MAYRAELDERAWFWFRDVDRAVAADGDIVNGVEDGIAGLAEADRGDDVSSRDRA